MTIEQKLQQMSDELRKLDREMKGPADERIQGILEIVYELLGIALTAKFS